MFTVRRITLLAGVKVMDNIDKKTLKQFQEWYKDHYESAKLDKGYFWARTNVRLAYKAFSAGYRFRKWEEQCRKE